MVNLSGENQSDQRDLIYLRFKEKIKTIHILKSFAIFLVRIFLTSRLISAAQSREALGLSAFYFWPALNCSTAVACNLHLRTAILTGDAIEFLVISR